MNKLRRQYKSTVDESSDIAPDSEDDWLEIDPNSNIAGTTDTMLTSPDFIEPNERDLIYSYAPAENNTPVSIFVEKNSEELSYSGIFCGQARAPNNQRSVPVTYGEIVKSELRNYD